MKKNNFLFVLFLYLMLIVPFACAEDYVPGEITRSLISDAIDAGQIVGGEGSLSFKMNESAVPEEDKVIADTLNALRLSGGFGTFENSCRLELGGAYAPDGLSPVDLTFALNLTKEGVVLESNLIPNECVSAKWETILALCGVENDQIQQVMSLREVDWDAFLLDAGNKLTESLNLFAELAQPYAVTLADFISTLNIRLVEDVPEDDIFPAVKHELSIDCPMSDLARFIKTLADQLEQDTALAPYLNFILSSSQSTLTISDLCSEMRDTAESMSSLEITFHFLLGYSDDSTSAGYLILSLSDDNSDAELQLLTILTPSEVENGTDFYAHFAVIDTDDEISDYVTFSMTYAANPENSNIFDTQMVLSLYTDGDELELAHSLSNQLVLTAQSLPKYQLDSALTFSGDGESGAYTSQSTYAPTQNGGEEYKNSCEMTVNSDFVRGDSYAKIEPSENGLTGNYRYTIYLNDSDVEQMGFNVSLSSWAYDPATTAALQENALETITNDGMNALMTRLSNNAQQKLTDLLTALPDEAVQLLTDFMN